MKILLKKRNCSVAEIVALVVSTSSVVKMKEHLPLCREFRILCIKGRDVVDHVV